MKKLLFVFIILCLSFTMSSCYTSKVYHGSVTENTPTKKVASKSNPILLYGLLPLKGSNQKAVDVIGDRKNYTTQTQWTFIDGLLNCATLGIYTPTTTSYYLPFDEK